MRVLVTGGGGFIGSHVAEHYAKRGEEVIVFDNLSRTIILGTDQKAMVYNWNYLKNNYSNVKMVHGDVRNFEAVEEVARYVDVIVHVAGQVAVTTSINDPKTDFEANALGTFNVLEGARKSKTDPTVLYCSTNKVYGMNVNEIAVEEGKTRYHFSDKRYPKGIPEDFPVDLCEHTPYGCSKLVGDLYVQDYSHVYGLKTGVFRMSCIYGERQLGVEDQGWVAWFTIATLTDKPITIYGDGKQVRDVLYVSDLLEAYDAFIDSKLKHGVFNIGGGQKNTLSLLELLDILEKITGKRTKISFDDWRLGDQKIYISDITEAQEKLGWRPKISPLEGVNRLIKWVQRNIGLFEPSERRSRFDIAYPLERKV